MKILYVTTIGGTMRFFPDLIRSLLGDGHTVDIATNEALSPIPPVYEEMGCRSYHIDCVRSPFHRGNLTAIRQLRRLVEQEHYDIVHCHTPIAAMCTRLACRKARKTGTKVYYTAHGFHFYKGAPLKNWLLFYPVEKVCAHMTDVLITMNQEDYALAKKKMKAKKIAYVPGVGINLSQFGDLALDPVAKRRELGVPEDSCMILSVGELNENKNHSIVLRALAQMDRKGVHYVIAGKGTYEERLTLLAREAGFLDRLHLIGYRRDIAELCMTADVFVFPSFREGLPVSIMEAMACQKAVACSHIRGNTDLIDEKGGFTFDPHQTESCKQAIENLLQSNYREMGAYNAQKVRLFSVESVVQTMRELYGVQ